MRKHHQPLRDRLRPELVIVAQLCGAASALSCVPREDLDSYASGPVSVPDASMAAPIQRPDTGSEQPANDGGAPDSDLELPEADTGGEPPRLDCRPSCSCELRAATDFMFCPAEALSRPAAEQSCSAAGGSLVNIGDAELEEWLLEHMTQADGADFWTAGSDQLEEGVWRWNDGRVFYVVGDAAAAPGYTAWAANQPNGGAIENCLRAQNGGWRDLDCASAAAYACQN